MRLAVRICRLSPRWSRATSNVIRQLISGLAYYNSRAREEELAKHTATKLLMMSSDDRDSVLLARHNKQIIGFCLSRYDDGVIWLSWFGVVAEWRNRGVGALLLKALEKTVAPRNCHKIWCDTRVSNHISQRVLRQAGYKKIAKLRRHWYGQDFYLWQKFIN
jgi:RimJ/RimL family protein N-acetyltransferase